MIQNILLVLLGVFFLSAFLSYFLRFQQARRRYSQKFVVVQVKVPKENEIGPIAAENVFATLHGIQSRLTFFQKLMGYTGDSISFEISSVGRVIKFYICFPAHLRNLVEGQFYAQYPDVEIEDCYDYAAGAVNARNALGVELAFVAPDVFPIKRYSQFEDKFNKVALDPLAGVTSSIVKFDDPDDQAWIQVVVTPLEDRWRQVMARCAGVLSRGFFINLDFFKAWYLRSFLTRKTWRRIIFFPLYIVFWFQGSISSAPAEGAEPKISFEEKTSTSHDREGATAAAADKSSRFLFDTTIRIVYLPKKLDLAKANVKLKEIVASFKQFNVPHLNGFDAGNSISGVSAVNLFRRRIINEGMILNNEELATIFHLPNLNVKTPTIFWVNSKKLEPPTSLPSENFVDADGAGVTTLGASNFRGSREVFGIKPVDRRRHMYIIGKTGMGKSTLLENMICSDILAGRGVGVIDPHGDLADSVLSFVPPSRTNDVILVDPSDREYAIGFNMLETMDPALNSIIASGLVGIFKKIYGDSWGPRLEYILRNTILSLLCYPGVTMLGIIRMLQDADFRRKVVRKVEDPVLRAFWLNEFEKTQEKTRIEAIAPILNKVGQFLSSQMIRNIVGQPKSSLNLRFAMDKGKIVIVNLSKGKIGEDNSALLGAMFITKFQLDAMSRANVPEKERRDFYLYVDEFQNFATDSFATILSEARKYKLNLTMANQYIAQMPEEVRDAVFGNVGSILSFQVGYDDAEYLSQQYGEEVLPNDLVSLSKYTAYMRLLIDGMPSKTFSLSTLPPPNLVPDFARIETVRRVSRERYARKISVVQDKIMRWSTGNDEEEM